MPNLIETYSRSTGLKIDRPWMKEDFYPLPFTRYITLISGSGQAAKNYGAFQQVIELLLPYLKAAKIEMVLLGGKDDAALQNVTDLRGKTSYHQSHYILKRALLHLGNDSWTAHAAGWSDIPLVSLYGSTDAYIHGPHWKADKTTLLASHRRGNMPSFSAQEFPRTIDYIDPFLVARSVLGLLEIPHTITQKTLNVGPAYSAQMMELVPNIVPASTFNPDLPIAVRMDLEHNEDILTQALQSGRKVNIVTKAMISVGLLAHFKASILTYNHEVDEATPRDYIAQVKKLIKQTTFFTRTTDEVLLARIRFTFFDVTNVEQVTYKTKADLEKAIREYLHQPDFSLDSALKSGTLKFKSQKYVLSKSKIYLSLAHERADVPMDSPGGDGVIDSDDWVRDLNHYWLFT